MSTEYVPVFDVIEESGNWTCPADGYYLVTCVAGGQGNTNVVNGTNNLGGSTSFGSYLTACGHNSNGVKAYTSYYAGGGGGYTLDGIYGGFGGSPNTSATKNGGQGGSSPTAGFGFGAGAGASYLNSSASYAGASGKVTLKSIYISKGTTVPCIVGGAGVNMENSSPLVSYATAGVIVIKSA